MRRWLTILLVPVVVIWLLAAFGFLILKLF
jgi:hypothetical protein